VLNASTSSRHVFSHFQNCPIIINFLVGLKIVLDLVVDVVNKIAFFFHLALIFNISDFIFMFSLFPN